MHHYERRKTGELGSKCLNRYNGMQCKMCVPLCKLPDLSIGYASGFARDCR